MSKKKKKTISTFRLSESSLLLTHPGNTGTCCGADAVAAASLQMSPINAERENKKKKKETAAICEAFADQPTCLKRSALTHDSQLRCAREEKRFCY